VTARRAAVPEEGGRKQPKPDPSRQGMAHFLHLFQLSCSSIPSILLIRKKDLRINISPALNFRILAFQFCFCFVSVRGFGAAFPIFPLLPFWLDCCNFATISSSSWKNHQRLGFGKTGYVNWETWKRGRRRWEQCKLKYGNLLLVLQLQYKLRVFDIIALPLPCRCVLGWTVEINPGEGESAGSEKHACFLLWSVLRL